MQSTLGQPGALTEKQMLEQVIRVNQAGEYGAKRIYAGQISVLKNSPVYKTIKHMAKQEEEHLEYFSNEIASRRIRPTALMPIWHVAGFAMGAITAMLGEKAAMACTVAVEEVIDAHYQEQLATLGENEAQLKEKIEKFRKEEVEHKNIGLENNAENTTGYLILRSVVGAATKLAIFLSKRI
jgi:ubiquinone biosynthesis monooxygenase Coq7